MLGLEWQCKKAAEATGNGKRLLVVRLIPDSYARFMLCSRTSHHDPTFCLEGSNDLQPVVNPAVVPDVQKGWERVSRSSWFIEGSKRGGQVDHPDGTSIYQMCKCPEKLK